MSCFISCGRHRFNMKSITVEPVMFLYMFSTFLMFITFQALVYEKVCNEEFNATVCSNLENETYKAQEKVVQKKTSTWLMYSNLAMGLPSLFTVVLFLGPWGDRVGRKIPVLCPLIGALFASVSHMINSVYIDASLSYLLIGNVLNGVMGGYIAALMAMYSYIAHISTPAYRTIKLGILEAMIFLSGTVGTALSGVILDHTSYVFVFSLLAGIILMALIYTLVWLDNIKPENTLDGNSNSEGCCKSLILDSIKDVFVCVYDKRRSKNFLHLAMLITILFFMMLVSVGENDIILVFTRHHPFEWSQTTLGLYKGLETFLRGAAVLTLLPLFKWKFKARDTTVMILGLVSKAAAMFVLGVGNSTAVLFIGAVSGVFQGFSAAGLRSLCSGMVSSHEQAKLFSLIGMFESISSLTATSLFNNVYNATLDLYHGFCFLMAAGILGVCIAIAGCLHVRLSRDIPEDYDTLHNDTTTNDTVVDKSNVHEDADVKIES